MTRMTFLARHIARNRCIGLETLEALVTTLLENKRTFFQMAPPTGSNSNSVKNYDRKKKKKELICTLNKINNDEREEYSVKRSN